MPNIFAAKKIIRGIRPHSFRYAGNIPVSTEFRHLPNGRIEYVVVLPATANTDVNFRQQDTNNTWRSHVNQAGTFALIEVVGGATNIWHTASGVQPGDRIRIDFYNNVIRGYVNGVLKFTRTTATNYQTATTGRIQSAGAGIRNLTVYA